MGIKNQIYSRYRFEVKRKQDGVIIGTGCFTHSEKDLTKDEQLDFLHEYTHNMHKKDLDFLSIKIYKVEL